MVHIGSRALPSLSLLSNAVLKSREGAEVLASNLWQSKPLAVLILRRPGCVLCRDEAQRLWALKPEFDKLGVELICVVHEWIQREIDAFSPSYWPGPLYHDASKAFYGALNGGTPLRGSPLGLLMPWSAVWARIRAAQKNVKEHNLAGEGLIMGGAMVLQRAQAGSGSGNGGDGGSGGAGGRVAWMHVESELGLVAEPQEVLEAARRVAAEGAR
ncbi:hypothetical protein GPECTOR_10g860 [Gonium pectorale]|uniref:Peroxiredoxin-like 2A n=1 Tax=Gonium pectorale TaxID=33097 RepID=A0A150GQW5_GONPE|nr:hypothetical protein GPECTOR_10g860 [Gonium pectorale]|eukprot:KXZ52229.1 hypothetical protein GPECTOR_10g860 [Gonium pectorale]